MSKKGQSWPSERSLSKEKQILTAVLNKCVGARLGKNTNEWSLKRTLGRNNKRGKGEIQDTVIPWKSRQENYKEGVADRIRLSW